MPTKRDCTGCPILNNPIFEALPSTVKDRALCLFRPTELDAGMPLFLEGFPAHSVFAIKTGRCKAIQSTGDGREAVLKAYGPGEFVGLDSLTSERYTHSVHATTRATICHAPRTVFNETVVSSPEFATTVIDHLSVELREMRRMMASLGTTGARGRVARLILGQRPGAEQTIDLPLSRRDTAAMLGMAEESLSRQLTSLEQDGVLRRRGRRLQIRDRGALEEISET